MKKITFLFILFALLLELTGQEAGNQQFFVGTFTSEGAEGIYLCDFSPNGKVTLKNTFKAVDNPSFLKVSPDKKYLYSVNRTTNAIENSGGFVTAYKINKNGNLEFLNKQVSNGSGPCHIDVSKDGKFVAIATYGGGTTSLYPVDKDGSLLPASTVINNTGSGADESRQSAPHAHCIKFSPFNNQVFSADLGTDQLNIYKLKNTELVSENQDSVEMAPGAGPRHFDFHPNGKVIYVINELNSTVTALQEKDGKWSKFQTLSTLPENFTGKSFCADIHVSSDGKYLYGSNRGHNSIAVFAVENGTGKLEFLKTVSVEGDWPRNFTLSPDGRFMLVANQRSNDITVFKIDKSTGVPEFTGNKITIPAPVCLEFF